MGVFRSETPIRPPRPPFTGASSAGARRQRCELCSSFPCRRCTSRSLVRKARSRSLVKAAPRATFRPWSFFALMGRLASASFAKPIKSLTLTSALPKRSHQSWIKARQLPPSLSDASITSSRLPRKPGTPATCRMPPRVWLHVSKLPRLRAAGGLPALAQAWQSVRQAATSLARLARTQIIRSGWRKPSRRQGWSLRASRRMRTGRRAMTMRVQALNRILLTDAPNPSLP